MSNQVTDTRPPQGAFTDHCFADNHPAGSWIGLNAPCRNIQPRAMVVALIAGAAGCQAPIFQGETATPQRPTLSSDTATTAVTSVELEVGGILLDDRSSTVPLTVKYGATDRTEIFGGWLPYIVVDRPGPGVTGYGDFSLGARHRLRDETEGTPSFALQSIVKFPTAEEEPDLGSGEYDFQLAGIATKSVGPGSLTGFAQMDLLGDPNGGIILGQSVALAGSMPLAHRFGFFGEVAGVFVPELDSSQAFSTIGFTYGANRALVFDVGVIVGLNSETRDFGVVFGLTRNFGRMAGRKPL